MDLLEMPLDAVAFHLYSLPVAAVVGSAWACFALLAAAALGLLSIRAVGHKLDHHSSSRTPPTELNPPARRTESKKTERIRKELSVTARPASFPVEEAASTPKARFTVYFSASTESRHVEEDDAHYCEKPEEREEYFSRSSADIDRRVTPLTLWDGGSWSLEWMVVKRNGDLGWYRYQDMAALNGSVVKLWNRRDDHLTAAVAVRSLRRRL
ncbi:hypothetical protein Cni_G04531 [Canna indica]|uniref:Uncharacterized protein n=1 Tax=Canna indica TaxID=4628 RepID=A0AAQ3JT34_9LILI|nr:hypothetical protein Cni_G04531 [Canna indica]